MIFTLVGYRYIQIADKCDPNVFVCLFCFFVTHMKPVPDLYLFIHSFFLWHTERHSSYFFKSDLGQFHIGTQTGDDFFAMRPQSEERDRMNLIKSPIFAIRGWVRVLGMEIDSCP